MYALPLQFVVRDSLNLLLEVVHRTAGMIRSHVILEIFAISLDTDVIRAAGRAG